MKTKILIIAAGMILSSVIGWATCYQYYMDDSLLPTHIQYVVMPSNDSLNMGTQLQVIESNPDHIKIVII